VVSGDDGATVFDVTDPNYRTVPGSQVAVADIDGDGRVEIVTCASGANAMIAFEHTGAFKWRTTDPSVVCGQAAPAIADLDADGDVEVFVRYTVVNGIDGSLVWHQACVGDGGWATTSHSPCDYTTAADLDDDGTLEVVGGNVAWNHDGSNYYDRT